MAPDGRVLVANGINILGIHPATGQQDIVATGADNIRYIAADREGTVFGVRSFGPSEVVAIDIASGTMRTLSVLPEFLPISLALDNAGQLFVIGRRHLQYVGDEYRVFRVDRTSGATTTFVSFPPNTIQTAGHLAAGLDGSLYLSTYRFSDPRTIEGSILRFTPSGIDGIARGGYLYAPSQIAIYNATVNTPVVRRSWGAVKSRYR